MKKKKLKVLALCLAGTMLFSGCGTVPYELTEEEEGIIVHYAAHVVSKFNTYQGDGLAHVNQTEEEAEVILTDSATEVIPEDTGNLLGSGGSSETENEATQSATLNDVFGQGGLDISYVGYEFEDNYIEDSVYAMQASTGKAYLVLHMNIENPTAAEIGLDNITSNPSFRISFLDGDGTSVGASAYSTLLLRDFATYDVVVEAGTTEEAVLLFEVPDTVTDVTQLTLQVELQGVTYEINL